MNDTTKRSMEPLERDLQQDDLDAIIATIMSEDDQGTADRYLQGMTVPVFESPEEPEKKDEFDVTFAQPAPPSPHTPDPSDTLAARAERRERQRQAEEQRLQAEKARDDKWQIALMGVASALCIGIVGVMIYWIDLLS